MNLFVMGPHAEYLHDAFVFQNLIDKPVLNIDAAGICAFQIPQEFLERRWLLKRVSSEYGQK